MATIELIAELHEIKESMCNAVRHVYAFTAVQQNTRVTNHLHHGNKVQLTAPVGSTSWTSVGNTTQEFERIIKICGKGNAFDINVKKFELKEKIPIAQSKLLTSQILDANANHDKLVTLYKDITSGVFDNNKIKKMAEYNIVIDSYNLALGANNLDYYDNPHNHKRNIMHSQLIITSLAVREAQATALHTRLTALINMIPVKRIYVKKVTPLTLAELNSKQLLTQSTQSKTKIHKISLDNCELRNLQASDYSLPITNLSEFANIQFYFRKLEAFRIIHLHCVGPVQYLIGNDHKLYVFMRRAHSAGGELVQGSYYDKLQCWTF